MGSSFPRLGLAALGLGLVACAFDWDGVYGARFGGDAQGGAGTGIPSGEYGGALGTGGSSDTGGTSDSGGTPSTGGTSNTGGAAESGGTPSTGGTGGSVAGCSGYPLENPGFELADKKGFPTGWERLLAASSSDGSVTQVTTPAYEGTYSLLVDTTNLHGIPPADYVLVVASTQSFNVTDVSTLYLSAVAKVDDSIAPIWVAVLYFDSDGVLLGDFSAGSANLVFNPSSGWVAQGPLPSLVPPLAAKARVGIVAGQGVLGYVDSVCLTW